MQRITVECTMCINESTKVQSQFFVFFKINWKKSILTLAKLLTLSNSLNSEDGA